MSRLQNQLPPGQRPPTPADKSTDKPRRKRVRLPFEPRQTDPGQWSYDHRAGIAITLILYLIAAIAFMWGKIELGPAGGVGTILVEFPEEKLPTTLTPEQIRALTASDYDFSQVRNLSSNENAELNSELRDDRGTEASEIYDQADGLDDKMEANREAYEAGLARERDMIERSLRNRGSAEGTTSDSKVKGSVTVSESNHPPGGDMNSDRNPGR